MSIALVSGAQLTSNTLTASPSWSDITLPTGRLLMAVGYRAGKSKGITGVSHPAISSATLVRLSATASATNAVRVSLWEVFSNGGTGTLTVTFDGVVYQAFVMTLELVGIGDVLAGDDDVATSASNLSLSATASGAAHGVAAAVAEAVNSTATLTASPWNDVSTHLTADNAGYAKARIVAETGAVSGQSVTVSMSSGNLNLCAGVLVLLANPVGGGSGGTAAAALVGAALPGV